MAVLLSATTASAFIDSYTISHDKLPEEAQQMLTDYFPKAKVSSIKIDRHLLKKTDYDVRLTNGIKIEFSNKGKWTYVTSKRKAIPEDLIPAKIRKYVADNYPDVKIISIRKKDHFIRDWSFLLGPSHLQPALQADQDGEGPYRRF